MIVTKTPLRISFVGGGTDLPCFYERYGGAVISTTIDKYVTVKLQRRRSGLDLRVGVISCLYKRAEQVKHSIVRECLRMCGIEGGISIEIQSDVGGEGTGLGTSSALTVGLLSALHVFKNVGAKPEDFARMACEVEIERLGKPIGKQDQYTVAYGGLRRYIFRENGDVDQRGPVYWPQLEKNLMLFRTMIPRGNDDKIFKEMDESKLKAIYGLVDLFDDAHFYGDVDQVGEILHQNWLLKRGLNGSISNSQLDGIYALALDAGAIGGKVLGAGGGGHFLFCVPQKHQESVKEALDGLAVQVPFKFESKGTRLVESSDG